MPAYEHTIFVVGDTTVHTDILKEYFVCDLASCKGKCCVEGDYGAPLEPEEINEIRKELEHIKAFMSAEGVRWLEEHDFFEKDPDAEFVTSCIEGKDCVFSIVSKEGIYQCAIEIAHNQSGISIKKPVSCHLYPVRVRKYQNLIGVVYDRWSICSPACRLGAREKVPVYRFVKEALIRKFGEDWYSELEDIADILKKENRL